MKIKVSHILMLCIYVSPILAMETSGRTEHEKTLSQEDLKIRDYFFNNNKIKYFFDTEQSYCSTLLDLDNFIGSFSHVLYPSANIANNYDRAKGISCVIRPTNTLIYAYADRIKVTKKNKKSIYIMGSSITAKVTSLAYTSPYILSGHEDGSLIVHDKKSPHGSSFSQCHSAPITGIIYDEFNKICVLSGGFETTLLQLTKDIDVYKEEKKFPTPRVWMSYSDSDGKPLKINLIALVGPFIVNKTKDNTPVVRSLYSVDAFNAIQYGRFSDAEKTCLTRIIDAQKNQMPMALFEEEQSIFGNLCPSIRHILGAEFEKISK